LQVSLFSILTYSYCNIKFDDITSLTNHKLKFCAATNMHPSKTDQTLQLSMIN